MLQLRRTHGIGLLFATSAACLAVFVISRLTFSVSHPRAFVTVKDEGRIGLLPSPAPIQTYVNDISGTSALMRPTSIERTVFYVTTGNVEERVWAIDHPIFDFVKDGDEPLHIFGTELEPGAVVAVYKEHGATRVSVITKDNPPPKGTGQWQEAGTQTVIEDDDLDGAKVIKATISGHVSDRTMRITFSQAKAGGSASTTPFKLQWTSGKPHWVAEK